ncbi:PREDICTED: cadherin-17 [Nanorana parkeri]|uniref:cadherin-17 n=1 Tax=Nanorana parkeri TaxID=125878 RepID=UPI0008543FD3|nr:PREDICTED: cadherin-17 [Nanorana parkeri]
MSVAFLGEKGKAIVKRSTFLKSNNRSQTFFLEGEIDNITYINPDDGRLYAIKPFNWAQKHEHKLQVKTLDSEGSVVEGPRSVTIIVDDINDHPPVFNQSEYFGKVREQSRPGIPFLTVYATDNDDPSTPNAQLVYKITHQIPDPAKVPLFQITNYTGRISTTINGSNYLKAEDQTEYELLLSVSDLAERPFSSNVKVYITVTENLWKEPKPVVIVENSVLPHPHYITQVRWNDDNVIYELQQRDKYPSFPFIIDQNGDINVTEPLDREERNQYIFYAFAKTNTGFPVARPLKIEVNVADVNDNPPVCPAAEAVFEVQENEDIGSYIGTFTATDIDEPNTRNSIIRYTLLEQMPKIPTAKMFLINEYDGRIQLTSGGLNILDNDQYRLEVNVSDEGRPVLSNICWIRINIIDINDHIPIFQTSDYGNITLKEDIPLGTVVMNISASDDDQPQTGSSDIIYKIIQGDPGHMFIIDTDPKDNQGYIKVAKPLDYEAYKVHELVIEATNPEPLVAGVHYNDSCKTRLIINILDVDERPFFLDTVYQAEVFENVTIGTKIITAIALDPEGDQIKFSLAENPRNWLRIDENTGAVYSNLELDRETQSHYQVKVIASEKNNPQMSSWAYFHLYLKDVNDNPPRLVKDYLGDFTVCHPISKPQSFEFHGTDDDYSQVLSLRFRLGDVNLTNDWEIQYVNRTSARLAMKHIKFPKQSIFVPVKIQDNGRPPLEATVNIPILMCTCTAQNKCETEPADSMGLPSVGMALGILFGVLAVIGIIIAAVFISMKQKKKKQSAQAGTPAEREKMQS